MSALAYPTLVYAHLLLFALWLGADVGVFILSQHFRRSSDYDLAQRLVLLKLLVAIDMAPRTAWALMLPVSLSVVKAGNWAPLPDTLILGSWIVSAIWLWLVWDAHNHDTTLRADRDRRIEFYLKIVLTLFYVGLGIVWLTRGDAPVWLAMKALAFGAIFAAAMMIDLAFRPLGGQIGRLIAEGSSPATEAPLLVTLDRTRLWVSSVYVLLVATSWLGTVKPG